jgi:hypothetical protein
VHSTMSACVLDFTVAKIDHEVVVIECEVQAAHVKLVLPPESTVDTDSLRVSAGVLSNKVRRGRQGRPHFVVRGYVRGGGVQVKRPWAIRIGPFVVQFPLKIQRDAD